MFQGIAPAAARARSSSVRILHQFIAQYSRKSDPNSENAYKVVKARVRLEDESGRLGTEGSLNWELFSSKGNRFFLPGSLGPAWVNNMTTIYADIILEDLVDFESVKMDRLHIRSRSCPQLLRENLPEIFPAPEVATKSAPLTMIELSYPKQKSLNDQETEKGARLFILAAREICARLRVTGYWCDFMNPFSGKPFHSYAGQSLYKQDQRFRGIGMKLESFNNCTVIGAEEELSFSGNIFTNAPNNIDVIKSLIKD